MRCVLLRSMTNRGSWIFGNNSNIVFRPTTTSTPRGFGVSVGSVCSNFCTKFLTVLSQGRFCETKNSRKARNVCFLDRPFSL
ncbi:unnamed protein product [Acanthoscelides obtectus]|uniref:Uncharacterized protein n=1 Tax=Acanthoscelides obtectus TaxID=200917 RepID=A0A9P0LRA0_ACAOB|nr:unnamed protein product [Acanthoscelides obtectus]CAK1648540.1 hypothetical protein AOBTE_LOCUS15753 [Acanthoscelides obtectus]